MFSHGSANSASRNSNLRLLDPLKPNAGRKSTNNGATSSSPIRITLPGQEIRRADIMASGDTVHVFGGQSDANRYGTSVVSAHGPGFIGPRLL